MTFNHKCCFHGSNVINRYHEFRRSYATTQVPVYSNLVGTASADRVTIFVHNTGSVSVVAYLQNSPDGQVFVNDKQILTIPPGETAIMTPYYFSKYMRMAMLSPDGPGEATLWFQIQRRSYRLC